MSTDPTAPATSQRKQTRNDLARAAGIPRWLRRYNTHYAQGGVEGIVACHLQNEADTLNHGRDRTAQKLKP